MAPVGSGGSAFSLQLGGAPTDAAREDYLSSYEGDRFAESMRYVRTYTVELSVLRALLPEIQTPVQLIAGRRVGGRRGRIRGLVTSWRGGSYATVGSAAAR
jgi:hypothetical protein